MKVVYRMCGIPSTNPSPIYQDDKDKLNELCLKSFIGAFGDTIPHVHFLCDYCPESYREMIESTVPLSWLATTEITFTGIGINQTALLSYEIAKDVDDIVLFQECDYVYRPDTIKTLIQAVKELGLVSPYDHLNFYKDKTLHSDMVRLHLVDNHHFRETERNTMTFATRPDVFQKGYEIFKKYGYLDADVWYELKAIGYPLHVPIPSIATHMVRDWLAPSVDWQTLWQKHL